MGLSPIQVGSERQLFLDDFYIATRQNVRFELRQPLVQEVAIETDRPWETGGVHFSCVLKDGDLFRMWYRSDPGEDSNRDMESLSCYAESSDGVHWQKPNLGLISWQGSRENNIFHPAEDIPGINPSVIIDPNAEADERYKMIIQGKRIILGYVSADGLRWRQVPTNPLLTEGPFDSHNILIWDDAVERYVIYMRGIGRSVPGPFRGGHRAIRRSESADFLHWSEPELVVTADQDDPPGLHLYTNATVKYPRAARAYFMFPMILYVDRTNPEAPSPGLSDIQFVFSRDGVKWDRSYRNALITPGLDERNWVDRNPIMGVGMLQTAPEELSMYYSELFRSGFGNVRLRRCSFRTDGFVSVTGPYAGWGEFTTHPLVFDGSELEMNYSTSGGGSILVELQGEDGAVLPGLSLDECEQIFGDKIEGTVRWKPGASVGALAGRPVRMRVRLRDADLYAFRFRTPGRSSD